MGQRGPYGTKGSYLWDKGILMGQRDPIYGTLGILMPGQRDPIYGTKGILKGQRAPYGTIGIRDNREPGQ